MVLSSPADLLCAVPYLVGFHPADSLVVTGFTGRPPDGRLRLTTRWDLPLVPGALDLLVPLLTREGVTQVMAAGFGSGALVTPAMDEAIRLLRAADITVAEALRAEDPRRARDLLAEAARLPLGVFALCEVVGSLAGVDPLEAEHLARGMEDPARRARALRNIATALTVTDPCRARDLLAEAEYLARALVRPHDRDTVLREVVQALVELDPYDAERLAHAIGSAEQQASALVDIAATLARYDAPPARCESAGDRPRGQEREPLNA